MQTSFLAGLAAGTLGVFLVVVGASVGISPPQSPEQGAEQGAAPAADSAAPQSGLTLLDLPNDTAAEPPVLENVPVTAVDEEDTPQTAADMSEASADDMAQNSGMLPTPLPDLAQPAAPLPAPDSAPILPQSQSVTAPAGASSVLPDAPAAPDQLAIPVAPAPLDILAPPAQGTLPARPEPKAMPGTPVPGRATLGLPANPMQDAPATALPTQQGAGLTALERNSLYDGAGFGAAKMALVLYDPGLPMPLRRAVAALDFPITLALNPLDPSASEAAEMYFNAGKEVIILAAGLPSGATPADIDVTLGSYLDSFPTAIGLVDLPTDGFARNAGLLRDVLAILQRDGHGLVTFAGGLSQAPRAALAANVPHAEIFRVLDPGPESQFTIRRFLDRAVFQASQMGQVIVYGDAANDATMEALEMWRNEGRADQVALVPVSAILLGQE